MHQPVLLKEVIRELEIREDGVYLDLTIGYGGHAAAILERIPRGFLIGIDRDREALQYTQQRLAKIGNNFKLFWGRFSQVNQLISEQPYQSFDGVLADLGVSSPQLEQKHRGFTTSGDQQLDMRMDQSQGEPAYKLIENATEASFEKLLKQVIGRKESRVLARELTKTRPKTANQLAKLIRETLPDYLIRKKNLLSPIFLAFRIAINQELEEIRSLFKLLPNLTKPSANLLFISFHSLEDKVIKEELQRLRVGSDNYKGGAKSEYFYRGKSIWASEKERARNWRARSAKLRVIKKRRRDAKDNR